VGLNSSETLGSRHSKAQPKGWAYNRVPTVPNSFLERKTTKTKQKHKKKPKIEKGI
jgi:hypothetical protein